MLSLPSTSRTAILGQVRSSITSWLGSNVSSHTPPSSLPPGLPVVLAGDYNVVPTVQDIYPTRSLDNNALIQPESRQAFARLLAQGWTDALRRLHPEGPLWTFWDYERDRWRANKGMRLDHFLLSPMLCERLVDGRCWVRGEDNASDHAPRGSYWIFDIVLTRHGSECSSATVKSLKRGFSSVLSTLQPSRLPVSRTEGHRFDGENATQGRRTTPLRATKRKMTASPRKTTRERTSSSLGAGCRHQETSASSQRLAIALHPLYRTTALGGPIALSCRIGSRLSKPTSGLPVIRVGGTTYISVPFDRGIGLP